MDDMNARIFRDNSPESLNRLYLTEERKQEIKLALSTLRNKFRSIFTFTTPSFGQSNLEIATQLYTAYINDTPSLILALTDFANNYPETYNYIMSFILGTRLEELENAIKIFEESSGEDKLKFDHISKAVVSQFNLLRIFLDIDIEES